MHGVCVEAAMCVVGSTVRVAVFEESRIVKSDSEYHHERQTNRGFHSNLAMLSKVSYSRIRCLGIFRSAQRCTSERAHRR